MRRILIVIIAVALPHTVFAGDIDRSAVDFTVPKNIKWVKAPGGMSRPHFHPNDRFFTVISGTWWVGTGEKFDPDSTVPVPAGSYVIHYGNKTNYDGAKGEETVIQVSGMGPATSTPAEKK